MRVNYNADWAFTVQNAFSRVVQDNFPQDIHRWPIIKTFNYDSFVLQEKWLIIVLKDKISGIVCSSGNPVDFKSDNFSPKEIPTKSNIEQWHEYLYAKLKLRPQDALMLIPIKEDSTKIKEDWSKFTEDDFAIWELQLKMNIGRHFYYIKGFDVKSDFFLPPGYIHLADDCTRFFIDHPDYNKNIFIMTRFVPGNKLLEELDREVRRVLIENNMNPLRADDKMYLRDRNLWNNVCVYMNCCKYGIAILEDRIANEFNPNVALEYGFMRALNKPVLLLADTGFRNLRADIIGTLREQFDITDIQGTIDNPIKTWLKEIK